MWLNASRILHTLKTKPIQQARLESHSEDEVKDWFKGYQAALVKYNITKGKNLSIWTNLVSELDVQQEKK